MPILSTIFLLIDFILFSQRDCFVYFLFLCQHHQIFTFLFSLYLEFYLRVDFWWLCIFFSFWMLHQIILEIFFFLQLFYFSIFTFACEFFILYLFSSYLMTHIFFILISFRSLWSSFLNWVWQISAITLYCLNFNNLFFVLIKKGS